MICYSVTNSCWGKATESTRHIHFNNTGYSIPVQPKPGLFSVYHYSNWYGWHRPREGDMPLFMSSDRQVVATWWTGGPVPGSSGCLVTLCTRTGGTAPHRDSSCALLSELKYHIWKLFLEHHDYKGKSCNSTYVVAQSLTHVQLFFTPWTAASRPPCPSPPPGVSSNSCPLTRWCHPTISSCHPFLLLPSIFLIIRLF